MPHLPLAVALQGGGWHPAAPGAGREEITAGYWAALAREAEAGLLDFLTIEDSFAPPDRPPDRPPDKFPDRPPDKLSGRPPERLPDKSPDAPPDRPAESRTGGGSRGRLDAVLLAARIAPLTRHIGLIPSVVVTHTEPFHASTAIATLDYVSEGRAGWRPRVAPSAADARLFGRRKFPEFTRAEREQPLIRRHIADLFDEASDYVEVVRRLWDSWEDDAVIRDTATGRFIDRDKLHYIDFEGRWFSVRGPSITPRPPQGQPVIAALAHSEVPYRFAARRADVVFVTPRDAPHAARITAQIKSLCAERIGPPAAVYADLVVFLDDQPGAAAARRARLDDAAGAKYEPDAVVAAGTPADIADLLLRWREAGLDGFRLRPGTLPHDLEGITRGLVPELRRRGAFRASYAEGTLRERLGLPRPVNRYEVSPS